MLVLMCSYARMRTRPCARPQVRLEPKANKFAEEAKAKVAAKAKGSGGGGGGSGGYTKLEEGGGGGGKGSGKPANLPGYEFEGQMAVSDGEYVWMPKEQVISCFITLMAC